jgi:hypothetical protein
MIFEIRSLEPKNLWTPAALFARIELHVQSTASHNVRDVLDLAAVCTGRLFRLLIASTEAGQRRVEPGSSVGCRRNAGTASAPSCESPSAENRNRSRNRRSAPGPKPAFPADVVFAADAFQSGLLALPLLSAFLERQLGRRRGGTQHAAGPRCKVRKEERPTPNRSRIVSDRADLFLQLPQTRFD